MSSSSSSVSTATDNDRYVLFLFSFLIFFASVFIPKYIHSSSSFSTSPASSESGNGSLAGSPAAGAGNLGLSWEIGVIIGISKLLVYSPLQTVS